MKKIVFLIIVGIVLLLVSTDAVADVERGDKGPAVEDVQEQLSGLGYTLPIDGVFGPKTEKAVKHFQRANKLLADGIVGPVTDRFLDAATATKQAVRGPQETSQGVDIPNFPNLCEEMRWFIQRGGLPEDPFMYYGMRESHCQNDAKPSIPAASCCRGWFAIHTSNISAPGYAPGVRACGITSAADYYGTSYEQKVKSVCFAKVLWDWYVTHPGSANPWRL